MQKHIRFQHLVLGVALLTIVSILCGDHATAAEPLFRLRADPQYFTRDAGGVLVWASQDVRATYNAAFGQPQYVESAVNGHAAVGFDGNAFLTVDRDDCFKGSYTLYVVVKHNGVTGANNIVSGDNHALWLANTTFPHVLHNGDFVQQAVSTVPLDGWCVLRVMFDASSGRVRIAVNNVEGASDIVPSVNDPAFYIGAYGASNFFNGQIAEVVYYHGVLSDADRLMEDTILHTRYAIHRAADPPPPVVAFSKAPKHLQLIPLGDSIRVDGTVIDASVLTVELTVDSQGVAVDQRIWTVAQDGPRILYTRGLAVDAAQYHVIVTASRSGTRDTVLNADSICTGVVIAISGQSNSAVNDPIGEKHPLARTFGGNFSQNASDTSWSYADPRLGGGGSTVGAMGMHVQRHMAERGMPSAVINGGVGGTSIQQHFPNAGYPEALTTIHGSWAYRRRVAQVNKFINWVYWYQGESNSGTEDYTTMFDSLYQQWHIEMPNLKRVMVIQIHTGCGGAEHALLREQQRLLRQRYPDVMVIAASGIPEHDGCHYTRVGYAALGTILAHHLDTSGYDGTGPLSQSWSSPDIVRATYVNTQKTIVRLRFRGYGSSVPVLAMPDADTIAGVVRTSLQAFFGDSLETTNPTRVVVQGDEVELTFSAPVSTVSYIPSTYYPGTTDVYQGPWLTNANGVGALTFFRFPVAGTSSVSSEAEPFARIDKRVVGVGERIEFSKAYGERIEFSKPMAAGFSNSTVVFRDMRGATVHVTTLTNGAFVVPPLSAAPYHVQSGENQMVLIVQ